MSGRDFESIYAAHSKLVYWTAFGVLKEQEAALDAAQNVFLRVFQHGKNLEKMNDAQLRAWLYRVATNAALDLLRRVRYDIVFSFIYSPRVGTPAAKMTLAVPREVSAERMERLLALQTAVSDERNKRFLGRRLRLLTEEVSRTDPSMLTGRGDPARPVHFSGDPTLIGSFVDVEITEAGAFSLTGKII